MTNIWHNIMCVWHNIMETYILLMASLLSSFCHIVHLRQVILDQQQYKSSKEVLNLLIIRVALLCLAFWVWVGPKSTSPDVVVVRVHLHLVYTLVYFGIFGLQLYRRMFSIFKENGSLTCSIHQTKPKMLMFVLDYLTLLATMLSTWRLLSNFNISLLIDHQLKPMWCWLLSIEKIKKFYKHSLRMFHKVITLANEML